MATMEMKKDQTLRLIPILILYSDFTATRCHVLQLYQVYQVYRGFP